MNFLHRLLRRARRSALRKQILAVRPDLRGKPFRQQLNTYITAAVDACVDYTDAPIPALLERALAYASTESRGHALAQYWIHRERYHRILTEHSQTLLDNLELRLEKQQTTQLVNQASQAVDQVTNAMQQVAEKAVQVVTDQQHPDNRLN